MIAVLLITVLFVALSVYFFFRAEKLQQTILSLKRERAKSQQENQVFSKSMALMAKKHEEFVKNRLQLLLDQTQPEQTQNDLMLIKPLLHNYALIFKECLMKKGKMHSTTKQCFSKLEGSAYQDFISTIIKTDTKIQRLWNSNNFSGFVSLAEAILVKYERNLQNNLQNNPTTENIKTT